MNTQQSSSLDLIHISTAARICGVSISTIRLWALSGRLPAIETSEGIRLFNRGDVERFAREREQRRAPAAPATEKVAAVAVAIAGSSRA